MLPLKAFEKNAWYLIGATRGGPMRAIIMRELMERPLNPNQLAKLLGVDYKTITHHLEALLRNNWVTRNSKKYAELYFPAFTVEETRVFMEIVREIGEKL